MTERAREQIRDIRVASGRRAIVLDDDPTGSQAVHDVELVFTDDTRDIANAIDRVNSTCFVLTNSRSLDPETARALSYRLSSEALAMGESGEFGIDIVSRGDSTLRGHTYLESRAVADARRAITGKEPDGILFAPAFFEASRRTVGDTHEARIGARWMPVGNTEFARDTTFSYSSSDLRDYLEENSAGKLDRNEVLSLSLETIRAGRDHIRKVLVSAAGRFVVINGESYDDFDEVALVQNELQAEGYDFVLRSGPSYVRSLTGIEPRPPLTHQELHTGRRGAIVVGSHVSTTTEQLAVLRAHHSMPEFGVDVREIVDPRARVNYLDDLTRRVLESASDSDVLIYTTRTVERGLNKQENLRIARLVSDALVQLVSSLASSELGWLVAKGGITSHDLAARGLGIRRARLLGQAFPGLVSVIDPIESDSGVVDMRYVIFPGNVGGADALSDVVGRLTSRPRAR